MIIDSRVEVECCYEDEPTVTVKVSRAGKPGHGDLQRCEREDEHLSVDNGWVSPCLDLPVQWT